MASALRLLHALNVSTPDLPTSLPERRSHDRPQAVQAEQSASATYGYHNTFHTHAQLSTIDTPPPGYDLAISAPKRCRPALASAVADALPAYSCSVLLEGMIDMHMELSSPFRPVSKTEEWDSVYAILRGTQLSLYKPKRPGLTDKSKKPRPGRFLASYTLQHAEVGIASDWKKSEPVPKSIWAHLIHPSARQKVFESEPQYFEPVREHVLRLRVETRQMLFCLDTHEQLLDWVENICAAMDISPPLEDRSEPRLRSLPRRNRRQRALDGQNLDNLSSMESGRRLIAEQERILRQLYPGLASSTEAEETPQTPGEQPSNAADPDADDLDPSDVLAPTTSRQSVRRSLIAEQTAQITSDTPLDVTNSTQPLAVSFAKSIAPPQPNAASILRYRRRCAPVLLVNSPRASTIIISNGKRMQADDKNFALYEFNDLLPPRYNAHKFPKNILSRGAQSSTMPTGQIPTTTAPVRPVVDRTSTSATIVSLESTNDNDDGEDSNSETPSEMPARRNRNNLTITVTQSSEEINILEREETTDVPPSPVTAGMRAKERLLSGLGNKVRIAAAAPAGGIAALSGIY